MKINNMINIVLGDRILAALFSGIVVSGVSLFGIIALGSMIIKAPSTLIPG